MDRVRVLEKRWILDDVFKVEEATIEHRKHDGSWSPPLRQLCFERGDSVAALLLNRDTDRLVLVNQFRYPTLGKGPGWMDEIVAGGLREDPWLAASGGRRQTRGRDPPQHRCGAHRCGAGESALLSRRLTADEP